MQFPACIWSDSESIPNLTSFPTPFYTIHAIHQIWKLNLLTERRTYSVHFVSKAYRYCRNGRLPSCGTKVPDKLAFPKSLHSTTLLHVRICATVRHRWRALKVSTGYTEHNCQAFFLNLKKQHKLRKYQTIVKSLHPNDIVFCVTSDMEPGAGIDKGWIPTLQDLFWVDQCLPQSMQCITCKED
jgi:hypothetical protein